MAGSVSELLIKIVLNKYSFIGGFLCPNYHRDHTKLQFKGGNMAYTQETIW